MKSYLKKKDEKIARAARQSRRETDRPHENMPQEAIMELQKEWGNEATAKFLGLEETAEEYGNRRRPRDTKRPEQETGTDTDPLPYLREMIRERHFNKGSNLLEYWPSLRERIEGDTPRQFMNLEFSAGRLVGGLFDGSARIILVAFLKNTISQTVNHMDMRRVNASGASSVRYSRAKAISNDIADSAVAIVLEAAESAKRAVEAMRDAIEDEEAEAKDIQTFGKVLPFLNIKKDREELKHLKEEMKALSLAEPGPDEDKKYELIQKKAALGRRIQELETMIKDKEQKKLAFLKQLKNAWKNLRKSEEDLLELRRRVPSLVEEAVRDTQDKEEEKDQDFQEQDENLVEPGADTKDEEAD